MSRRKNATKAEDEPMPTHAPPLAAAATDSDAHEADDGEDAGDEIDPKEAVDKTKSHPAKKNKQKRLFPHPPRDRPSLLTEKVTPETFQGLVNLGVVILLIVNNYRHRGFLVDIAPALCLIPHAMNSFWIYMIIYSSSFIIYFTQYALAKKLINIYIHLIIYWTVQAAIVYFSIRAVNILDINPVVGCVLHLKLHSYVMTNKALADPNERARLQALNEKHSHMSSDEEEDDVHRPSYPENVNLKDFVYFLVIPSLVYEPHYPRRRHIDWFYVGKELLGLILCSLAMYVLGLQYVIPAIREDAVAYRTHMKGVEGSFNISSVSWDNFAGALATHTVHIIKTNYEVLHVSIPSIIIWLCGFYSIFHCGLNVISELTKFADRRFYQDWWNASSLSEFWRKWNIPVHEWMLRHVFLESMKLSKSKLRATFLTFLVSAILHEYILMIAVQSFQPWFFFSMVFQVPLILLTPFLRGPRWGNLVVWASLFLGQPLLQLLYVRQYSIDHQDFIEADLSKCSLSRFQWFPYQIFQQRF